MNKMAMYIYFYFIHVQYNKLTINYWKQGCQFYPIPIKWYNWTLGSLKTEKHLLETHFWNSWRVASSGLREKVLCNLICPKCSRCASDALCTCGSWSTYWFFILSSGLLNRTPSHMHGRLYFPMFLLRVGFCTPKKVDSLMILPKILPIPAHNADIVHCGDMVCGWLMAMYWWRCLQMLPEAFTKGFSWPPLSTLYHIPVYCTYTNILFHSLLHFVLTHQCYEDVLGCSIALEISLYTILAADTFNALMQSLCLRYDSASLFY